MSGASGGFKAARRSLLGDVEGTGNAMAASEAMKPGTLSVEGEYATIRFERRYRHPVDVVWRAITEPEHLARWYMTKARLDPRPGGSIDYVSGISQFHVTGKILTWDPPRVFEHEWNVEPREYLPKGERSVLRWQLVPDGDSTILRLTHRHLTAQTATGFIAGTHAFLERLEEELDGKPLRNWVKRVEELRAVYPRPW